MQEPQRRMLNMRHMKSEPTWITDQPIDLNSAVEELHGVGSQELNKILRDSEILTLQGFDEDGLQNKIDMERLARCLPVHLIAVLVSSGGDEIRMRYLLRGFRLLQSLSDLAARHNKLEQILLEEVRVTEQIMDLIFFAVVVLARYKPDIHATSFFPLLHSALVACSLHLLSGYISSQWRDLAQVLIAHPEVDLFMDAAFNAVRIDIIFLQTKLSTVKTKSSSCNQTNFTLVEKEASNLCQHCEASLQFLQSLCQQKLFRERLLKNEELCKNAGILSLVKAVLNLDALHCKESPKVAAAVSRMKSKVLSILLQLCETESISYLDEVASSPNSMQLAKFVALEVLKLLKTSVVKKPLFNDCEVTCPRGLVLLNTMRLADIFSDDSNFRYFITVNATHVLAEMLLLPHEEFLTSWCSADLPVVEEDASLDYDPFMAAGVVSVLLSTGLQASEEPSMECNFNLTRLPQASYAQHRTSLLVKIIANLHCFVPNICEEQERNLFFNKFLECLIRELPISRPGFNVQNWTTVCKNLGSLLDYAKSLIPTFLNEEDVQLLSKFLKELQSGFTLKVEGDLSQETHHKGHATPSTNKLDQRVWAVSEDFRKGDYPKEGTSESLLYQDIVVKVDRKNDKSENSASGSFRERDKDPHNVETSGSEASSTRGTESLDPIRDNGDTLKRGQPPSEERQRRKRKRNVMNGKQIAMIEQALVDEPEMQRSAVLLQSWADKLSHHGSELTSSQLKNWLNNRRAKLARVAKGTCAPSDGVSDKSGGLSLVQLYDSHESGSDDLHAPPTTRKEGKQGTTNAGINLHRGNSETSKSSTTDISGFPAQQSTHA